MELSTGTPRGSERRRDETLEGVAVPGVDGGVKAGERRDGGGGGCCCWVSEVEGCCEGAEDVVEATSSWLVLVVVVLSSWEGVERENSVCATSLLSCWALARGE